MCIYVCTHKAVSSYSRKKQLYVYSYLNTHILIAGLLKCKTQRIGICVADYKYQAVTI
jgi:hypothetical protein